MAKKTECTIIIDDLITSDMQNPLLVEKLDFSWKIASKNKKITGVFQKAYKINLYKNKTLIWTSRKVYSKNHLNIKYFGLDLEPASKYEWAVTVWDNQNVSTTSNKATFWTALDPRKNFFGSDFIKYDSPLLHYDKSKATPYNVEIKCQPIDTGVGICYTMEDVNNFCMLNISYDKRQDKIYAQIKKRKCRKFYNGSKIDITDKVKKLTGATFPFKKPYVFNISVKKSSVELSMLYKNKKFKLATFSDFKSTHFMKIGFMSDITDKTYKPDDTYFGKEFNCFIDKIKVIGNKGNILYKDSFSKNITGFDRVITAHMHKKRLKLGIKAPGSKNEFIISDEKKRNLAAYRKVFNIKEYPVSAMFYVSSLGVNTSFINGKDIYKVSNQKYQQVLNPGFSECTRRLRYSCFDVSKTLKKGKNVICAVVGSGWWAGRISNDFGGETAYISKLILKFKNGDTKIINTNTTWKCDRYASTLYSDIFQGQTYDARCSTEWLYPDYDDSKWQDAAISTEFNKAITPINGSAVFVRPDLTRRAKNILIANGAKKTNTYCGSANIVSSQSLCPFKLKSGYTALIDFGQNASGWEKIVARAKSGTKMLVRHGEFINDTGDTNRGCDGPANTLYTINLRGARAVSKYIFAGNDKETWEPSLTFYGFRYIEISANNDVEIFNITAQTLTSVNEDCGKFKCSNKKVNKIYKNTLWGMYSNYLSVPTDCPQRDERQGWSADCQVFAETGQYLSKSKLFLQKYCDDMYDCQSSDGGVYSINPKGEYNGAGKGALGWADACVIIPYTLYKIYGDVNTIKQNWELMDKYVAKYLPKFGFHGPKNIYGDWLAYESNDEEIKDILAVAHYFWVASMMQQMSKTIKNAVSQKYYEKIADKEKSYFIKSYITKDGSLIRNEQCPVLYAIYLGLYPNKKSYTALCNQLVTNIKNNGYRLQTGFLGTRIILDVLTKIGRSDLSYKILLQEKEPSWLYSINQGATTMWERWNSYTLENGFGPVGMNSFNHYAYGAVVSWIFRTIAGINVNKGSNCADIMCPQNDKAFEDIYLNPVPCSRIKTCKCSYNSVQGNISIFSVFDKNSWTYSVIIPVGSRAWIRLPKYNYSKLKINNKITELNVSNKKNKRSLSFPEGINDIKNNINDVLISLTNGSFIFKLYK